MKKIIVLLLMILPLGAIAQEVKIAFVKTQEVFMAMPEVSGMEKQMADLNEKYRVELKQMQDEYQKKYSDFVAQQDSLTENIKLRRMQEIQDIQERMDNFVQVAQQDVQKKQQEFIATDPTEVARGYPEGRRGEGIYVYHRSGSFALYGY